MEHDIIVIAASAGGVQALKTLVAGLPQDLKASLFIVLHVPATKPSMLPLILNHARGLPALHPTDGMAIEQGKIYVAPPDHHLILEQGQIHLGTGPKENYVRPSADVLFRSAANSYGSRVVGIVLTGLDHDGTKGLIEIKQHGGISIVQEPEEAPYPSMPKSALRHDHVNYIIPLSNMAPFIVSLVYSSISS